MLTTKIQDIKSSKRDTIKKLYHDLLKQEAQEFPKKGSRVKVSTKQGVYVIYNKDRILHVGKTNRNKKGLNGRLQDHLYNQSSFTIKYFKERGKNNDLREKNKYAFIYLEVKNHRDRAYLEAYAAGMLCAYHIGTGEEETAS